MAMNILGGMLDLSGGGAAVGSGRKSKKKQQREKIENFRRAHMSMMIETRRFAAVVAPDDDDDNVSRVQRNVEEENEDHGTHEDDFLMLRKQLEEFDRHGTVPSDLVPALNLNSVKNNDGNTALDSTAAVPTAAASAIKRNDSRTGSSALKSRFSLRLHLPNFKSSSNSSSSCSNGSGSRMRNMMDGGSSGGGGSQSARGETRAKRLSIMVKNLFTPNRRSPRIAEELMRSNSQASDMHSGRRRAMSNAVTSRARFDYDPTKHSPRFREDHSAYAHNDEMSTYSDIFRDDDTLMSEMIDTELPSDDEDDDELDVIAAPGTAEHEMSMNYIARNARPMQQMSPRDYYQHKQHISASPPRLSSISSMIPTSPRRRKITREDMVERHNAVMKLLRDTYAKKSSEKVVSLERKRLNEFSTFSPSTILQSLRRDCKLHQNYLQVNQYFGKKRGGPLEKAIQQ